MKAYVGYRTSDPDPIVCQKPEELEALDARLAEEVQMSETELNKRFEAEAIDVDPRGDGYESIGGSPAALDSFLDLSYGSFRPAPVWRFPLAHLYVISTTTVI